MIAYWKSSILFIILLTSSTIAVHRVFDSLQVYRAAKFDSSVYLEHTPPGTLDSITGFTSGDKTVRAGVTAPYADTAAYATKAGLLVHDVDSGRIPMVSTDSTFTNSPMRVDGDTVKVFYESAPADTFYSSGITGISFNSGCVDPTTGDCYFSSTSGHILIQTGGSGALTDLNQTVRNYQGMTADATGNIYVEVSFGDIYKRTAGAGDFIGMGMPHRVYRGMTSPSNGNVYVCSDTTGAVGGDIFIMYAATDTFVPLGEADREWRDMAAGKDNDVYAVTFTYGGTLGDIYIQTHGAGTFISLGYSSIGNGWWRAIGADTTGTVYAFEDGVDGIYRQLGGVGNFELFQTKTFGQVNTNDFAGKTNGEVYMIGTGTDHGIWVKSNEPALQTFNVAGNSEFVGLVDVDNTPLEGSPDYVLSISSITDPTIKSTQPGSLIVDSARASISSDTADNLVGISDSLDNNVTVGYYGLSDGSRFVDGLMSESGADVSVSGNIHIANDDSLVKFGATPNAAISYDGSDFIFNSSLSGGGEFVFNNGRFILDEGNIVVKADDGNFLISGGDATNSGANLAMFGGSHATLASVFRIRQNGTTRMYMNSAGKTGFNTTSPVSTLHVNGEFRMSAASKAVIINDGDLFISNDTTNFLFSGGSATNSGANMALVGGSHPTLANLFRIRQDAVTVVAIEADHHFQLPLDDQQIQFGAGQDAGISYDGTDIVYNSQVVGSGDHVFEGGFLRADSSRYRRYYHLPMAGISPGASGPTWTSASANNLSGWQLNASTEELEFDLDVHTDWDSASDLCVEIYFQLLASGNPDDEVHVQLVCYYMGSGDVGTKTQTIIDTIVTDGTQYKMYEAEFDIDYDYVSNVVDAGDKFSFEFTLVTGTSDIDDILTTSGSFFYNTTHIGMEDGDT